MQKVSLETHSPQANQLYVTNPDFAVQLPSAREPGFFFLDFFDLSINLLSL
jgi:hypothetical protein